MNIYWVAMVLVTAALGLIYDMNDRAERLAQNVNVSTIASSMLVYRNALAEYAYAHNTASGTVSDDQLDLPNWYFRYPGVEGVIAAGKSFAFYSSPPPGLIAEMVNVTGGSLAIGSAASGTLVTPLIGNTGITLPASVPNGAAVAYQ
ncbi:type IV pilus biogenesis protein PilM [Pseudomonas viridiflava]|uniref:type IV pilus biogenesis protein PilM n=1 Tax=Pseudomonas viridiflava TaxID=33069 RepID=UPI002EA39F03|nr:type IV pilus biogenesis protein PilM [Pseudomonas viridiflava]